VVKKLVAMILVGLVLCGSAIAEFDEALFESFGYERAEDGGFTRETAVHPALLIASPEFGDAYAVGLDVGVMYQEEYDAYFALLSVAIMWLGHEEHTPETMIIQTNGGEFSYSFTIKNTQLFERETAGLAYTAAICFIPFGSVMQEAIFAAADGCLATPERETNCIIYSYNEPAISFAITLSQLDEITRTYAHYIQAGGNQGLQLIATNSYAYASVAQVNN